MLGVAITLDRFADLHEEMEVRSRAHTGLLIVYSGFHPEHGECVLIQHYTHGAFFMAESRKRQTIN